MLCRSFRQKYEFVVTNFEKHSRNRFWPSMMISPLIVKRLFSLTFMDYQETIWPIFEFKKSKNFWNFPKFEGRLQDSEGSDPNLKGRFELLATCRWFLKKIWVNLEHFKNDDFERFFGREYLKTRAKFLVKNFRLSLLA